MTQWKYVGERKRLFGIWFVPGMVIEEKVKPQGEWIELGTIETKKPIQNDAQKSLKEELSKMTMKELRMIGDKYKVYDTSKKELINEILGKANVEDIKILLKK